MYHATLRCIHVKIVAMEKQEVLHSMSVCVSALLVFLSGVQITCFLCCILVSCVAFLAPPYFAAFTRKWHNFQKIFIKCKRCVLIFSTTFV
jgi:hypothetical protein